MTHASPTLLTDPRTLGFEYLAHYGDLSIRRAQTKDLEFPLQDAQLGQDNRDMLHGIPEVLHRQFTAFDLAGEPVGLQGVHLLWDGVGQVHAWYSRKAFRHAKALSLCTRWCLNYAIRTWGLHRIQATVESNHNRGANWMKHLGFEREGLMRHYSPEGLDHEMWAWVAVELQPWRSSD